MGKKKKTGKSRLDKFYHLAKEQGYRARSAFKLIQLNRKYDFLSKARVCIDLCAAPGGWCQVAVKHMPVSSVIIGVDLVPIRSIPRVVTLVDDITTEKCRADLRRELKSWKADVVLHDGAPNVGSNWTQDAFSQATLTLSSLKLAVEFLTAGGTFVTKVFRSKDYHALMWVFQQLFKRVEATKPMASRNESAEIFVVCQGFLAPDRLDPKLLDTRYVFRDVDVDLQKSADGSKEVAVTANAVAAVFSQPKKRAAEGYANETMLYREVDIATFVNAGDPIAVLADANRLVFGDNRRSQKSTQPCDDSEDEAMDLEDSEICRTHPATTPEILELCADLKVLGKGDFKLLLKWRKTMRDFLAAQNKDEEEEESQDDDNSSDEEEEEDEFEALKNAQARDRAAAAANRKREKRKDRKKMSKERSRMELGILVTPEANLDSNEAESLFALKAIKTNKGVDAIIDGDIADHDEWDSDDNEVYTNGLRDNASKDMIRAAYEFKGDDNPSDAESDDSERYTRDLEKNLDIMYDQYKDKNNMRNVEARAQKRRRENSNIDDFDRAFAELDQLSEQTSTQKKRKLHENESDESSDEDANDSDSSFDSDDLGSDHDSDVENDSTIINENVEDSNPLLLDLQNKLEDRTSDKASMWFKQDLFTDVMDDDDADAAAAVKKQRNTNSKKRCRQDDSSSDEDQWEDEFEVVAGDDDAWMGGETVDDVEAMIAEPEGQREQRVRNLTAETMAAGAAIFKNRTRIPNRIDEAFNRHSHRDDDLPSWFTDNERQHVRPGLKPPTKEDMAEYKLRLRELDARPIKKIAEAKARKKYKQNRREERARKRAAAVMNSTELSESQKAEQASKIMQKAKMKKKTKKIETTYVVAKKSGGGKIKRPEGVKGRIKMVDPRMKKELRAMKAKKRTEGRKKKKGGK